MYAGGNFNYAGVRVGGSVGLLDANTGNLVNCNNRLITDPGVISDFGTLYNANNYCAISDGAGGWYIASTAQMVGTMPVHGLYHVFSDFTPDTMFRASVDDGLYGFPISAMVLQGDTLYLGGSLASVNGQIRTGIAAVNAVTGALLPLSVAIDGQVKALYLQGTTMYIGGNFYHVNGANRKSLAGVSILDGSVTNFNGANSARLDSSRYLIINTLAAKGDTLFAGGNGLNVFTGGGPIGISHQTEISNLAAFSISGGDILDWNPQVDNEVYALTLIGEKLYFGGTFGTVAGVPRPCLASYDLKTQSVTDWLPGISNGVVTALAHTGSKLFAGGDFFVVNGVNQYGLAAYNSETGALVHTGLSLFNWYFSQGQHSTYTVTSLVSFGESVLVSGWFTSIGYMRKSVAAFDVTTHNVTAWNPGINGDVFSLLSDKGTVYVGGNFTTAGGQSRNNLAALDSAAGLPTAWNPGADGTVKCLALNGNRLYAGGDFSFIGGQSRNRIAALNFSTGAALGWNPGSDGTVETIGISGKSVFAGGNFSTIGGQARANLAALDTAAGLAAAWNPNPNGAVHSLAAAGNTVYAGGNFTQAAGSALSYLYPFEAADLSVPYTPDTANSGYSPRCGWEVGTFDNVVADLAYFNNSLYSGGWFRYGIFQTPYARQLYDVIDSSNGYTLSYPLKFIDLGYTNTSSIAIGEGKAYYSMYYEGGVINSAAGVSNVIFEDKMTVKRPDITVSGDVTCNGTGPVTLTAPAGYNGYIWGTTPLTTTGFIGNYNPNTTNVYTTSVPGSYSVLVKKDGSWSPVSLPVTIVRNTNTVTASVYNNRACEGVALLSTASGTLTSGTALWYYNGVFAGSQNATKTFAVTEGGAYTVAWVADGCTTQQSAPVTVTVSAAPVLALVSSQNTGCGSVSSVLKAQAGSATYTAYRWLRNGVFITETTADTLSVSQGGNYTLQGLNTVCTSAVSNSVLVSPSGLPAPIITLDTAGGGAYTEYCEGTRHTSFTSDTGGSSYIWYKDGAVFSTQPEAPLTVNATGSYSLRIVFDTCTTAFSSPVQVTVHPVPGAPAITASGPATFCQGGSVTLSAPAGFKYLWNNGDTTQSITVNATANVTVQTISNGCTSAASAATAVTVTPLPATPVITPGGPTGFCQGDSVTLSAPAGFKYLWSSGDTTQSITVNATANFTVQTISNGCTSVSSEPVAVAVTTTPATPAITPSGATTFCRGGRVTLTAPAGFTYLWNNGSTAQSIDTDTSGSYSVQTITGTCSSAVSAVTAVTVTPLPGTPGITLSGPSSFCQGDSVRLTSTVTTGNLWSSGDTTQSITVHATGSYSVSVKAGGCTSAAAAAVIVTVTPAPATPAITPSGATTFCQGGSVTLTAPAGFTYLWSNGATSQSISTDTSGSYSVKTITGTCTSAASAATRVRVNALPSAPVISFTGGQLDAGVSGASYAWYFNTNLLPSLTTRSIPSQGNGSYTVKVTDANGCTSLLSAAYTVTGLAATGHQANLQIVPNPSGGYIRIAGLTDERELEIYTLLGQKVHTGKSGADTQTDISHLAAGIYEVRIAGAVLRLVKE